MTITFWNWWFSIVIDKVIELHVQVGWLVLLIALAFLIRVGYRGMAHNDWDSNDCDC
jgi:hypothetical protein